MQSSKSAWIIGASIILGSLIVSYPHQRTWSSAFIREVGIRSACEQMVGDPGAKDLESATSRLRVENCVSSTLTGR